MKTGTVVFAMIVSVFVFSCVTPPQSIPEFREGMKGGGMMTKTDHRDVSRSVNDVFQDVKKNADKCLNVRVTGGSTPGPYGGASQYVTYYHSHSRMTGKTTGEMVMQMDARASGKMPEGGYFTLLTDVESISSSKTRVTIYGPSMGYENVFEAIFDWANGKDRACPSWMR
jgi:hypothetical protein